MAAIQTVDTPHAPQPAGHYAQATVHAGVVYTAGQLPINPHSGKVEHEGDAEAQTELTLRNVDAILRAAGTDLSQSLSITLFVTGRDLWPAVNTAFNRVLGSHKPARAIIPVPELKEGCTVEIQCIAAMPEGDA